MSTLPLHLQLRNARRSRGISQVELAQQVECKQSAISMMEGGRMSALARPTLEKIAAILGVELPPEIEAETPSAGAATHVAPSLPEAPRVRICPNSECPGNIPYRVGEEVFFLPKGHHTSGNRCPYCGEVLVGVCPECGAPLHAAGGCCTECGASLITAVQEPASMNEAWLRMRQQQATLLLSWNAPQA